MFLRRHLRQPDSCCAAIADATKKAQCQAAYGALNGNDLACGAAYSGYKAAGDCP